MESSLVQRKISFPTCEYLPIFFYDPIIVIHTICLESVLYYICVDVGHAFHEETISTHISLQLQYLWYVETIRRLGVHIRTSYFSALYPERIR